MVGQVKEKQEAKAEYEKHKAKGDIVAHAESKAETPDIMKVNIGNVTSDKPIKITFCYLQELDICLNKFWKLMIPSTLTPLYQPKKPQNMLKRD